MTDRGGMPPDDVDVLDLGPRRHGGTRPGRRLALALLAVAVVAGGIVALLVSRGARHPPHAAAPTPGVTVPPAETSSASTAVPAPLEVPPFATRSSITVTRVPGHLLGVRAPWELFALGERAVVRVEFARGRVVRTTFPGIASSGAVSLVAARGKAIVRPWDYVTGYAVADGQRAHVLTAALAQGGPALPGPDPNHVWIAAGLNRIWLVGVDGRPTGLSVRVPAGDSALEVQPDQRGDLLFRHGTGAVDVTPSGPGRTPIGRLLAAGPTRWLSVRCRRPARCAAVVTDRSNGAFSSLPISRADAHASYGVVAPDGRTAALVRPDGRLALVDCRTGRSRTVPVRLPTSAWPPWQQVSWAPGDRLLFAIDARRHVDAVAARSGRVVDLTRRLGHALPPVRDLAIRPAG